MRVAMHLAKSAVFNFGTEREIRCLDHTFTPDEPFTRAQTRCGRFNGVEKSRGGGSQEALVWGGRATAG